MWKEVPTSIRTKFQAVHCKASGQPPQRRSLHMVLFSSVTSPSFTFPCKHQYVRSGFIRHARGLQLQALLEAATRATSAGRRGDMALQQLIPLWDYKTGCGWRDTQCWGRCCTEAGQEQNPLSKTFKPEDPSDKVYWRKFSFLRKIPREAAHDQQSCTVAWLRSSGSKDTAEESAASETSGTTADGNCSSIPTITQTERDSEWSLIFATGLRINISMKTPFHVLFTYLLLKFSDSKHSLPGILVVQT